MRLLRSDARWCVALLAALMLGCGDNNPVYPVRGKVMYDGKPMVGGGSISLVPLSNQPGKTAGGEIKEDGSYTLSTYSDGDGSMPGEFRVVIYQVIDKEPPRTKDGQKPAQPTISVPSADRIPTIYADSQKSPLKATIEAKSINEINFDLDRT